MKVTFENATIADSINKAGRVAPTKGEAFDKRAGILMSLDPEENTVTLRSTNLDLFYLEVVDAVSVEGEGDWLFPSPTITGVMAKLPIGSGKEVTLSQEPGSGEVILKSNRTTAKFRVLNSGHYDKWPAFDPELLEMVPDLGARIAQIEWAAESDNSMNYAGIHLDGKYVMGTDRIRIAITECEAEPIYKPITIPAGILKPVISGLRDVAIGIQEGTFLMMPDTSTQLRTRIYDRPYPDLLKVIDKEWPNSVKFRKTDFLEIVDRAMVFGQRSRDPKMTFIVGKGEIAVMIADADTGLLGDAIELDPGQADHKRTRILFTPKNLTDSIGGAPSEEIELMYDIDEATKPVLVNGGSGYRAMVMPRREVEEG